MQNIPLILLRERRRIFTQHGGHYYQQVNFNNDSSPLNFDKKRGIYPKNVH